MDRSSLIFCAGALLVSLAVSAAAFPYAALSAEELRRARTPASAESLPAVEVGGGFGRVEVIDLVGYYMENPPQPKGSAAEGSGRVRHFGGC